MPETSALRLANGSLGDPVLYLDFPGEDNAVLVDAGEFPGLSKAELRDVAAVLLTHHHMDHLVGFDRVLRAVLDTDKTVEVLGPEGTIERVEKRLGSYLYQRFPFMKVRFRVTELGTAGPSVRSALFDFRKGFAREDLPAVRLPRRGLVLSRRELRVRFAPASHTVPCLAYSLEIRRGWRFDRERAAGRVLSPGPWVQRALLELARPRSKRAREIAIEGRSARFRLEDLSRDYFVREPARKIAFVTDTRADPAAWPGLVDLARGAWRLYCDSYYACRDEAAAQRHGHLTAPQAARLAREAGVGSLWLMHLGPKLHARAEEALSEAWAIFPETFLDFVGTA
ncbi:MAG: MBL fold metallo-hydrolase [Planctomycetes bacterium]|nr:MBL fold metallo-hydrolase [Planctomycetota bacterium]